MGAGALLSSGDVSMEALLIGIDPRARAAVSPALGLREGRFFEPGEKGVLLNRSVAGKLGVGVGGTVVAPCSVLDSLRLHDHYGHMKAGVAELKAGLSRYLERVKAGQEVLVTDRGQPVAKIVPIGTAGRRGSRRARLVREGMLLPGRGRVRSSLLRPPAGSAAKGRAVLDALVEERREGR